jgi:hypothetical protein
MKSSVIGLRMCRAIARAASPMLVSTESTSGARFMSTEIGRRPNSSRPYGCRNTRMSS